MSERTYYQLGYRDGWDLENKLSDSGIPDKYKNEYRHGWRIGRENRRYRDSERKRQKALKQAFR